jgi:hypothetical protein
VAKQLTWVQLFLDRTQLITVVTHGSIHQAGEPCISLADDFSHIKTAWIEHLYPLSSSNFFSFLG